VQRVPAFVPTASELITTKEGAERAKLSLLSADPGSLDRRRGDYQLPPIAFGERSLHTLEGADGGALEDIRSPADNLLAADFITETVRGLTADADSALHVSIVGGRKTMGYYLGYALSLFRRPQDRLSHVLVSEPFESSWNFFYPSPYSRVIELPGNKLADTAQVQVTAAARDRRGFAFRILQIPHRRCLRPSASRARSLGKRRTDRLADMLPRDW